MAIYPGARWLPLPENDSQGRITPRQVILHTAVSAADSLHGFYNRPGVVVESQFYVARNHVEQYIDTTRRADANRQANGWAISIESWDNGQPEHTPWTPTQMDLLAALVAWCCDEHGIPARFCPAWDAPGIGWHTMWGAPSPWTPVAKTCPGGPRKAQMPELLARVQQNLAGVTATPPPPVLEEDDMLIIESDVDRGFWFLSGDTLTHLAHGSSVHGLKAAKVEVAKLADEDFVRLAEAKGHTEAALDAIAAKLGA